MTAIRDQATASPQHTIADLQRQLDERTRQLAHVTYGTILNAMRMPERALREFQLAVGLDPKLATAHAYLGLTKLFLGRARDTRAHVEEAMRLSSRDPLLFH